ncbi:hypothetical protein JCM11251_006256 [Rhodosporidiobolus azoricus]
MSPTRSFTQPSVDGGGGYDDVVLQARLNKPRERMGLAMARDYALYCRDLYARGGIEVLIAELNGLKDYEQKFGTSKEDWLENEEVRREGWNVVEASDPIPFVVEETPHPDDDPAYWVPHQDFEELDEPTSDRAAITYEGATPAYDVFDDGVAADFGGGSEDEVGGMDLALDADGAAGVTGEDVAASLRQPFSPPLDANLRSNFSASPILPGSPVIPPPPQTSDLAESDCLLSHWLPSVPPHLQGFAHLDLDSAGDFQLPTPPSQLEDFAASLEYNFAPLPRPALAGALPEIERPADLGIGPSDPRPASTPLPDELPPRSAGKRASASERKRKKLDNDSRKKIFKRQTIDWQDVDLKYLRLPCSRTDQPGRVVKKRVKVVRNSSSYKPKEIRVPRPFDPYSEECLLQHFNHAPKKRAIFTLSNYRLVNEGDEAPGLLALSEFARTDRSLVLVGDATPVGLDDAAARLVRLNVVLDRGKLPFHAAGPVLTTALGSYILAKPALAYEASIQDYRRLLNVFTFARSCRFRGGYAAEDREILEFGEKVRDKIRATQQENGSRMWQESLPEYWRLPIDDLAVRNDQEVRLLFSCLPNIPFFSPIVAKLVYPFLPKNCFRTSDHDKVKKAAEDEQRRTKSLLKRYRRIVAADETSTRVATFKASEPLGSAYHPEHSRRKTRMVDVYGKVQSGAQTHSIGDLVLVRPGKSTPRRQTPHVPEADDEGSDWEDESDNEEERVQDQSRQSDTELWLGRVEYFFHDPAEREDQLQAHITWFACPWTVPSLRSEGSPRRIFQLDDCTSIGCSAILSKVDHVVLRPGDAVPKTGFYSNLRYSVDDGSFSDPPASDISSIITCARNGVRPCQSCESTLVYAERTDGGDAYVPIPSKQKDILFTLAGICYHPNDFILVHPCIDEGRRSSNLPLRLARLIDFQPEEDEAIEQLSKVRVEWIVRAVECGIYGIAGRKKGDYKRDSFWSEREIIPTGREHVIATTRIEGHFDLVHFEPEDVENALEAVHLLENPASPSLFWVRRRVDEPTDEDIDCVEDGIFDINDKQCVALSSRSLEFSACSICRRTRQEEEQKREKVDDAVNAAKLAGTSFLELEATALYAGGGFLDLGLARGCPAIETSRAVEHHRPAAEFMLHNHRETQRIEVETVSDNIEQAFHEYATGIPPHRPLFLSGGSPCQGFSSVNRYKKAEDLRCLEPFTFLSAVSVHRPLAGLFENVSAFHEHALPIKGAKRGSFFRLFIAVLVELGYQMRWNIDDAAAQGVPQHRRRLIVTFALSGFPLPAAPRLSYAVPNGIGRRQFDHALLEDGSASFLPDPSLNAALHYHVPFVDITSDLPDFGFEQCFTDKGYREQEIGCAWGFDGEDEDAKPDDVASTTVKEVGGYKSGPLGTAARRLRLNTIWTPRGPEIVHSSLSHHVCRSVREKVAMRLVNIGVKGENGQHGNYRDLDSTSNFFPTMPDWVQRHAEKARNSTKGTNKAELWWSRLRNDSLLAPLRTKLNIDGSSHGPRLHPTQSRFISVRECIRAMAPDCIEWKFDEDAPDESCDELIKAIGNAVPVALAEAYGRAFYDAIFSLLLAAIECGQDLKENIFEAAWRRLNPHHEKRQEQASAEAAKAFLERERRLKRNREDRTLFAEKVQPETSDDEVEASEGEDGASRACSPRRFAPIAGSSELHRTQRITRTTTAAALDPSGSASPAACSRAGSSPIASLSRSLKRKSTRSTSVESDGSTAKGRISETTAQKKGKGKGKAVAGRVTREVEVLYIDCSDKEGIAGEERFDAGHEDQPMPDAASPKEIEVIVVD